MWKIEEERTKSVLEKMDRETGRIILEAALKESMVMHEKSKFTNTAMMGIDSLKKLAMLDQFTMEYPVSFGKQLNLMYKHQELLYFYSQRFKLL